MLKGSGVELAIITGGNSRVVEHRARNLGIEIVHQGAHDKLAVYQALCRELNIDCEATAYMGDDVVDLPVMRRAGLAITVPAAPELVKAYSHYTTTREAGRGAVRESLRIPDARAGHAGRGAGPLSEMMRQAPTPARAADLRAG